jgi:hypothetical protein
MRIRALIAAAMLGPGLGLGSPQVSAQSDLENKIKAAIVSKFPQFVEWPASAVTGRSTIDLCIVPADPIESDLNELTSGETLDSRQLTVRHVTRDQDVDTCHVLFIRAAAVASNRGLLRRASTLPVLTVSDDQKFLEDGGIVRLRQVGGRLRFDVNAAAAQRAGLRISSQLLQLALTVLGGPA